jgi:hypothetical protein
MIRSKSQALTAATSRFIALIGGGGADPKERKTISVTHSMAAKKNRKTRKKKKKKRKRKRKTLPTHALSLPTIPDKL